METIIGIILLMALLSLPDLLRKKRKYPTRGHSRPGQKPAANAAGTGAL